LISELQAEKILVARGAVVEQEQKLAPGDEEGRTIADILANLAIPVEGKMDGTRALQTVYSQVCFVSKKKVENLTIYVYQKFLTVVPKLPPGYLAKPLFTKSLSDKQMETLKEINGMFSASYSLNRQMLLKRLEVTFQSFLWSEKGKAQEQDLKAYLKSRLKDISPEILIPLSLIWTASQEAIEVHRVTDSEATRNTNARIKKTIIGEVPNRGGRTDTSSKSMPSFRERVDSGHSGHSGHRGRGRGHRGNAASSPSSADQSPHVDPDKRRGNWGGYRGKRGK